MDHLCKHLDCFPVSDMLFLDYVVCVSADFSSSKLIYRKILLQWNKHLSANEVLI